MKNAGSIIGTYRRESQRCSGVITAIDPIPAVNIKAVKMKGIQAESIFSAFLTHKKNPIIPPNATTGDIYQTNH